LILGHAGGRLEGGTLSTGGFCRISIYPRFFSFFTRIFPVLPAFFAEIVGNLRVLPRGKKVARTACCRRMKLLSLR